MDVTFHRHVSQDQTIVCDVCGSCVADTDIDRAAHREWHYVLVSIGR